MVLCATMSMAQNDPLDSKKDTVSLEEVEQSNIIDDDEFSFAENGQQYNQAKISRGAIVIATSTVLILAIGIVVSVILAP